MVNLFISNPLVFTFESNFENKHFKIVILHSNFAHLPVGSKMDSIDVGWANGFTAHNVVLPPKLEPVIDEMPWI